MKNIKRHRYELLTDFCMIIRSLHPNTTVSNQYADRLRLPAQRRYRDARLLYDMLVESLTLLHKTYREQDKNGVYQSDREDYVMALDLMQPILHNIDPRIKPSERQVYAALLGKYGLNRSFKRNEAEFLTKYSKTRMYGLLQRLECLGLVKKKGHKNTGFKYLLLPYSEEDKGAEPFREEDEQIRQEKEGQQEQDIFKDAFEEWEDYQGFENF